MKLLTQTQEQQILGAIRPKEPFGARDRALLVLDLHTGLRSCELCGLNVEHVATRSGARSWLDLPSAIAKGKHSRCVPLNETARAAIDTILRFNADHGFSVAPGAPLLVARDHRRLSTRQLRGLMQRYRERAELDIQASPHTLRHSCASRLASSGVNLRVVQKIMGHARLATVEIYTHATAEEMEEAVSRLDRRQAQA